MDSGMNDAGPNIPSASMAAVSAEGVRTLAELCARAGVEEIAAADGTWSVRLRLDHSAYGPGSAEHQARPQVEPTGPYRLISEWVGVFHRSADAGAPAYVEEGQH